MVHMRTLYIRNVPDEVMDRLERLAKAANMSVTAVAIRELDAVTRRADNGQLIGELPDLGVSPDTITDHLHTERR
jgi:hypothetical protein